MKKECDIVQDLLPAYLDHTCSDASKEYVAEHLAACKECRELVQECHNGVEKEKVVAELPAAESVLKKAYCELHKKAILNCLLVILLIPILWLTHCEIFGEGFSWRCIPARIGMENALEAIASDDREAMQRYIRLGDDLYTDLHQLGAEFPLEFTDYQVDKVYLDDGFLHIQGWLTLRRENLTLDLPFQGTWSQGQAEFILMLTDNAQIGLPSWLIDMGKAFTRTWNAG